MEKKTHTLVPEPEIDVRHLADYMAGSEVKRRSLAQRCKYRPIARLVQHKEAKITVSSAFVKGELGKKHLEEKAKFIRSKMTTDEFDALTNEVNADFVQAFAEVAASLELPDGEILPGKKFPGLVIEGVKIRFTPNLMLRRLNPKTNKPEVGGVMFRYAKGKALSEEVAEYQSSAMFGLFSEMPELEGPPEKALCLTLDVFTGNVYAAPGKAATMFKNMKAACATIAERWPNIKPPKKAVL